MDIKKWMQEGLSGSVTVESAMLMPFVLGLVFLLLTFSVSLYDRCLFEQEGIRLEVRATSGLANGKQREEMLKEKEGDFPGEHLLLGEHGFRVESDGREVYMQRTYHYVQPSNIVRAFEKLSATGGVLSEETKVKVYDPVGVIRNIRKLEKLKDALDQAGDKDE